MSRQFERIYPYLVALLATGIFWYYKVSFPKGQDILAATITLGAVFTGFLATLKSIVIGLQGTRLKKFKGTKFFPLLLQYLREAIWASIVFCALGLSGFFYDPDNPPQWFGFFWVLVGVITLLTFQRVSSILLLLIQSAE